MATEPRPTTEAPPPSTGQAPAGRGPTSMPPASLPPNSLPPPPLPPLLAKINDTVVGFIEHLGQFGRMTWGAIKAIFDRPLEIRSTIYQMESLGVRSAAIASVTALFVGMVMAVQFAIGLAPQRGGRKRPAIVRTVASEGKGIGELLDAINASLRRK